MIRRKHVQDGLTDRPQGPPRDRLFGVAGLIGLLLPIAVDGPAGRMTAADPLILLLGLVALWARPLNRRFVHSAIAFLSVAALSSIYAVHADASIVETSGVLVRLVAISFILLTAVYGYNITAGGRLTQMLFGLSVHVAATGAFYLFLILTRGDVSLLERDAGGRLTGLAGDPNAYGLTVCVCLIWLSAGRATRYGRPTRVGLGLACLFALLATGSRTSWVALACVGLGYTLTPLLRVARVRRYKSAAVVVVAILVSLALADQVEAIHRLVYERPSTASVRVELISTASAAFQSNPLFGVGLETTRQGPLTIHATIPWIAAEMGAVGLIAFFSLAILPSWSSRDSADTTVPLALLTYLVGSFGIEAFFQRPWWLMIGAAWALHNQDTPGGVAQ